MQNTKKLLGQRIKELRKNRSLTQAALAESIGVDPKTLSRIEVGAQTTSFEVIENIALALNTEIRDLFSFQHIKSNKEIIDRINFILNNSSSERLQLIYKIIDAVDK